MLLKILKNNFLGEINNDRKDFPLPDFSVIKIYTVSLFLVNALKHCGN